jgi:hypothetical protein
MAEAENQQAGTMMVANEKQETAPESIVKMMFLVEASDADSPAAETAKVLFLDELALELLAIDIPDSKGRS